MLLREILINNQTGYLQPGFMVNRDIVLIRSVKMGVVIVSIVPIIAVYPFIQRYFVKGVMIGAIKS
jgi:putative aldouronate transport system permease protein